MTMPSSGEISMSDINLEMLYSTNAINTSLNSRSVEASKGVPHNMSEFYSYNFPGDTLSVAQTGAAGGTTIRVLLNGTQCTNYTKTLQITCGSSRVNWTATSSDVAVCNFSGYSSTSGTGSATRTVTLASVAYARSITISFTSSNISTSATATVSWVSSC